MYATVKRIDACTKQSGCVDFNVRQGFSYPLSVATGRETKNVKGKELEFSGNAIKIFFFVLIDLSKEWEVLSVTCCTLKGKRLLRVSSVLERPLQ